MREPGPPKVAVSIDGGFLLDCDLSLTGRMMEGGE